MDGYRVGRYDHRSIHPDIELHMALPAHQSDELIVQLNQQLQQPRPDELALRRIVVQAERLLAQIRGSSEKSAVTHSVIGMVQFMQGAPEKGRASFRRAFTHSASSVHRMNYGIMLRRHCFMEEAYTHYMELARTCPDNIDILKGALETAGGCLQLDQMNAMRIALEKLNADLTRHPVTQTFRGIPFERLQTRLRERVADAGVLVQYIDVAGTVVRQRFGALSGFMMEITDEGEALLRFAVAASPCAAAEGSFAIAEALVSRFEDPLMDVLTMSCVASAEADHAG